MKIQRYELELFHCNGGEMYPDENGAYVCYEDHKATIDRIKSRIHFMKGIDATCQAHNAAMRFILQVIEEGVV